MQVISSDNWYTRINCCVNVYVNIWIECMKVDVQKPGIYIPFAVTCNASRTLQNA
jgi:hypothetical protein